tara:strand:- start:877 stop:3684 length:2808 start_codon:yes stop_codon:yes gene_type:complete
LTIDFVALDLETTGLNSSIDAITEIGATKFNRQGETIGSFQTFINPNRSIPEAIEQLTGITNKDVESAPQINEVIHPLINFIGDATIIGQNIKFDLSFLSNAGIDLSNANYDTWELSSILFPRASHLDLSSLAELVGVEHNSAHRALADAEVTRDVFLKLMQRLKSTPKEVLSQFYFMAKSANWNLSTLIEDIVLDDEILKFAVDSEKKNQNEFSSPISDKDVLDPIKEVRHVTNGDIEKVFLNIQSSDNLLPDYEIREGQHLMSDAFVKHLSYGGQLLIEAGTGTGKSLAYLIPALIHAGRNKDRVVVSTHTINLQDQLMDQEIPLAIHGIHSSVLDGIDELHFTELKGRSNYLCLERWQEAISQNQSLNQIEARLFGRVANWISTTETGDLGELYITSEERPVWNKISAEGSDCFQHQRGRCFIVRAKQRAERSHLVVVNHALLISNLIHDEQLLPSFNHLVVDEIHRLEEVATQQFGAIFDPRRLREFLIEFSGKDTKNNYSLEMMLEGVIKKAKNLPNTDEKLLHAIYEKIDTTAIETVATIKTYIQQLRKFARDHYENDKRPRRFDLVLSKVHRSYSDWIELEENAIELDTALDLLVKNLQEIDAIIDEIKNEINYPINPIVVQLRKLISIVGDYRLSLDRTVLHQMPDDIVWISAGEGELKIKSAPVDVAPMLEESLFMNLHSVLGTSATIQANSSFNITANRLGFSEVDSIEIQSPFNYKDQVLVLVIDDIPDPNHVDYQSELCHLIAEASMTSVGRTLALFTSHNALRNTASMLRSELSANNLNLLAQGLDGSPRRLIKKLQEDPASVILGTSAFWEGVDIPGDTLSQMILTRLPFPVPSDPIFMGRSGQYQDPFSEYTLPQAILKFRQGFGRLIRRSTDRGVFIIADSRISKRSYGPIFLDALPNPEIRHIGINDISSSVNEWLLK